ncbi:MAG: hypothetical protein IIB10_13600 [Chloroflexi bacterium]|nr:hypothetical protein [Chloroflexota bacterium]
MRTFESVAALGLVAVLLGGVGVFMYLISNIELDVEYVCTPEVVVLFPPNNPELVQDALSKLVEANVMRSIDAGTEALVESQYIFDPEEQELEYWLYLQIGGRIVAAEFNMGCPLDEEGTPLFLEYEASRIIG